MAIKIRHFVQTYGFDALRACVKEAEPGSKTVLYKTKTTTVAVNVNTAKRILESWQLLEDYFNIQSLGPEKAIENARVEIADMQQRGITAFFNRYSDHRCMVRRMANAIKDIEMVL